MVLETKKTYKGQIAVTANDPDSNGKEEISKKITYYFDTLDEHTIDVQNQITDNYVEDNTAIHDHIAHAPLTITISGLIGEKVYYGKTDDRYDDLLNEAKKRTSPTIVEKLSALTMLYPPVDNATQLARNTASTVISTVNRIGGLVRSFGNRNRPQENGEGTEQDREPRLYEVYRKLMNLRATNTPMTVATPFTGLAFMNMYIQSIRFHQGNENYRGDISITLKRIDFAAVNTTKPNTEVMSKYNAYARAEVENCGTAQGVKRSFIQKMRKGYPLF